jgi:hypothetical protein
MNLGYRIDENLIKSGCYRYRPRRTKSGPLPSGRGPTLSENVQQFLRAEGHGLSL